MGCTRILAPRQLIHFMKQPQTELIIRVDASGTSIGSVEKWEAHKKGILHKGFTVGLIYKSSVILQQRKHIVFDKTTDCTASSHALVINSVAEPEEKAVMRSLMREWMITSQNIKNLHAVGSFVYKAFDAVSGFTEHEYCTMYQAVTDTMPKINKECAYGLETVPLFQLRLHKPALPFAPWAKLAIELLLSAYPINP